MLPQTLRAGTPELPAIPPFALAVLGAFLPPLLVWVERLVFRQLLTRCADHPLVLLAQWYDPAPVVAVCASYRHPVGSPGAPPTFSLAQLVRAEIVRAWADSCSDPELEFQLASNLLLRWFVGLPLVGPTPDHSTLNRFHAWLTAHAPDALFRDVLRFLGRVDPEDPSTTPQIVDTFAMASPAQATSSPAHLLRHLCLRLARCWLAHAPPALQWALPPLDLGMLARPVHARTAQARQAHLQEAVSVTRWLVDGLTPHLPALDPALRVQVEPHLQEMIAHRVEACAVIWGDQIGSSSDDRLLGPVEGLAVLLPHIQEHTKSRLIGQVEARLLKQIQGQNYASSVFLAVLPALARLGAGDAVFEAVVKAQPRSTRMWIACLAHAVALDLDELRGWIVETVLGTLKRSAPYGSTTDIAEIICHLAPYLRGDEAHQALTLATPVRAIVPRVRALAAIAAALPSEERAALLVPAWQAASRSKNADTIGEALTTIVVHSAASGQV